MKSKLLLLLLLVVAFTTSCSITYEKRLYRKGYHVEVHKNNSKKEYSSVQTQRSKENNVPGTSTMNTVKLPQQQPVKSIKTVNKVQTKPVKPSIKPKAPKAVDCDIITLKNGDEIEASVVKISDTEVEYKKCNSLDGPTYVVKTSDIIFIKLKNGDKYIPPANTNSTTSTSTKTETKGSPVVNILSISFAALALILLIAGWLALTNFYGHLFLLLFALLFSIAAIVLGAKGMKRPWKGLGIAGMIAGIIIAVASIAGLAIYFIFYF